MLKCRNVVKHACDYHGQRLGFWQRIFYKFHLFICVRCRRYVDQMALVTKSLGNYRHNQQMPEDTYNKLVKNLKSTDTAKKEKDKSNTV